MKRDEQRTAGRLSFGMRGSMNFSFDAVCYRVNTWLPILAMGVRALLQDAFAVLGL